MNEPVQDDIKTCLTYYLGFEHTIGIQFLCSAGLLKVGNSRNSHSTVVVKAEWDKFIEEEQLSDFTESLNITSVSNKRFYFVNFGRKGKMEHRPIDQFNGKKRQVKVAGLAEHQSKLHKRLYDMLMSLRHEEQLEMEQGKHITTCESDEEEPSDGVEDMQTKSDDIFLGQSTIDLSLGGTPRLLQLFGGNERVPKHQLNAILLEIFSLLRTKSNSVDFFYNNGNKGRAIIIPQVKSQDSFMRQAKRLHWIDEMLSHISSGSEENNLEDSAQWLTHYIAKKYDGSFTLACEGIGIPLVQRLDSASTLAMWSDANVNYTQQRIIKKHLRLHFGKRLFLPDTTVEEDNDHYAVPTSYGEYKYYKNKDMAQKPERCPHWCRDPSLVVANEISRLLDYLDPNVISTRFNSLIAGNFCTLVAGADQGQGAWRSWIKVSTISGAEVRERLEIDTNFDVTSSYLMAQVAHITCKKDNPEILAETVSKQISDGYSKLLNFKLCFIQPPLKEAKVKPIYIPKDAQDIKLEESATDPTTYHLVYSLHSGGEQGFTIRCSYEETFEANSTIKLNLPKFMLFITGDLAYYADVLGMPNSSSYWCPWCLVTHREWQADPDTYVAEKRTSKFLSETYLAVKMDTCNRLKPTDKKGVSTEVHYKGIGPERFVPPLLHMEMGMVNQVWDAFEGWIDAFVEIIPPHEKEARQQLADAKGLLNGAAEEKRNIENTVNIEIREKNGEIKALKSELRRKTIDRMRKEELHSRLTLLESFIAEAKAREKTTKERYQSCQLAMTDCKKKMENYRAERGKPEASILTEIEEQLEKFNASRAAYHGGDFNGVSCRRIVGNAKEIIDRAREILVRKKDETCDDATIHEKLDQLEQTLGLLDAAYSYLSILHPTDEEKRKAREAVEAISQNWRTIGLSISLKAHVLEKHTCDFHDEWGVGDKEESFIEQGHQIGLKDDRRYCGLKNFKKRTESTLKVRSIATHPLVMEQRSKVLQQTKRRKINNDTNPVVKRGKKEEVEIKKEEKRIKREFYISNSKKEK